MEINTYKVNSDYNFDSSGNGKIWCEKNCLESKPLFDVIRDFLTDSLVLKIILLMKQEEIDRREMQVRIGDRTYYKMEDMSKVFLRAFSRAYTKTYGGK
jgi:hypothetical protein